MLIFRYLAKELFITLASLTGILMLIFMSNQFVRYLNRAASGQFPLTIIMKLMMLELPNLMGFLLPLGFYISLLIAYGRLYADSEMTVLQACGYGPSHLLRHSYIIAFIVAGFVLVLMLWVNPLIENERAKLLRTSGIQTMIQTIVPGHFTSARQGRDVFYVESMNRNHTEAQHLFLARQVLKDAKPQWSIVWADKAYAQTDPNTYEDYLILKKGSQYEGSPGQANYQIVTFDEYKARLPHPTMAIKENLRAIPTAELWSSREDRRKAAELQWRLSIPLMSLSLTLVAVPLSRVNPRSGKFAKLLPAIVLYILYANFMFIARDWVAAGKVPVWIGMWWLHGLILLLGLVLMRRNRLALG